MNALSDLRSSTLVGRTEEVAHCSRLLASVEGAGLVITGAAGVGKTRLAAEVLRAAEDAGYATARVTATEAGRAIPLGPFAHLLPAEADAAAPLHLLRVARAQITEREDGRPLALLVDDAHLLDGASALLVQQLAASGEAWMIATVRSGEPAPDAVVALWKDHGCEYLELQPLSFAETGVLVESLVGGEVDGQTKHRLWEASRGVPLVLRELVLEGLDHDLLGEQGRLWRWQGPLRPGGRLLELIAARVGQLDDAESGLLELVAVGEPLAWSLLSREEAAAAEALMRRELIVVGREGSRVELHLAHPLYGEAVRARMPVTRTATLQRRLADALESTEMHRSADLLRYAIWRLDSGGTAPVDVLLQAALLAQGALDSVLAERLARAAVDAGGGVLAERAVARALLGQERFAEADAILLPLAAAARTDEERTWVALTRAHNLVIGLGRGDEAEAALISAQQAISDRSLWRELELVRCWVLSQTGRPAEAAAASTALLEEPDDADREFCLRTAGIGAFALVHAGRSDDALALLDRWQRYTEEQIEYRPLLSGQYRASRGLALLFAGRLQEAEISADEAYSWSVGQRASEATALMAFGCGVVALHQGRLHAAHRWCDEARGLLRDADPVDATPAVLAVTAQALGQAGDTLGAKQAAAAAEKARRPRAWLFAAHILLARAWAAAAAGALTEAQRLAREAADLAENQRALAVALRAAHDLHRLGDPNDAAHRLTRFAENVQGSLVTACAEHAQAVVSGDARRIEAAAAVFADMGASLWAAEAESEAASVHRRSGRESSASAAAARAALLLERCEGARTPALALAGPVEDLTPREREIATMAAGGASNREIAERLVVSVRTVENNLQRAYRKLGVRNRHELARVLRLPE